MAPFSLIGSSTDRIQAASDPSVSTYSHRSALDSGRVWRQSKTIAAPIVGPWKGFVQQVSSLVSDNRAIDLTKLAQHQFLLGVRVSPYPRLMLQGMAGYEIDAQQDERDEGFTYQAGADVREMQLEEFRGTLHGHWEQSLLTAAVRRPLHSMWSLVREFERRGEIPF